MSSGTIFPCRLIFCMLLAFRTELCVCMKRELENVKDEMMDNYISSLLKIMGLNLRETVKKEKNNKMED